ncbi:Excisionase (fragment) [Candidatus Defluviicoccus seviourii]|uniref:Excisionase n=2 Tax=root TaxID=1 RepID=A0A564WF32_9PROT
MFSIRELTEITGLGRTSLYSEIKRGYLRPLRIGRRTIVPADEVRAWLQRRAAEPQGSD